MLYESYVIDPRVQSLTNQKNKSIEKQNNNLVIISLLFAFEFNVIIKIIFF
jgi:hypothetical protein